MPRVGKSIEIKGLPDSSVVKNPPANAGDGFDLWVGKIPWRRKWQPTPLFWPGKSHGQRSPEGHSPWGHQESDTTEQACSAWHSLTWW